MPYPVAVSVTSSWLCNAMLYVVEVDMGFSLCLRATTPTAWLISGNGIIPHPEKSLPTISIVSGDRFVEVLGHDLVIGSLLDQSSQFAPLTVDRVILSAG